MHQMIYITDIYCANTASLVQKMVIKTYQKSDFRQNLNTYPISSSSMGNGTWRKCVDFHDNPIFYMPAQPQRKI